VREAATICPRPYKLTFDLLTLKVVTESRVTWATYMPILVFLGLSVLDLGPMYATDILKDTPCRMFVFLLVVHCVLSSGIIKETMNE